MSGVTLGQQYSACPQRPLETAHGSCCGAQHKDDHSWQLTEADTGSQAEAGGGAASPPAAAAPVSIHLQQAALPGAPVGCSGLPISGALAALSTSSLPAQVGGTRAGAATTQTALFRRRNLGFTQRCIALAVLLSSYKAAAPRRPSSMRLRGPGTSTGASGCRPPPAAAAWRCALRQPSVSQWCLTR
jgi:hypothetical protein